MNQDQRKFLLARVEKAQKEELRKLQDETPSEPSLNNYLIAAMLDNSIELKSLDEIKASIRKKVLALGPKDTFTSSKYTWRNDDAESHEITLMADILFVYPKAYLDAYAEWEAIIKEINQRIQKVNATSETLLLKIQIGSNTSLDRLVDSVDNMIDLTLMNNKLMLGEGKEEK
jgi:hypothetical protein